MWKFRSRLYKKTLLYLRAAARTLLQTKPKGVKCNYLVYGPKSFVKRNTSNVKMLI